MSDTNNDSTPAVRAFTLEDNIGYQMRRIVTLIGNELDRRMEPLGLTEAQWKPLLRLYLHQQGKGTVASLARGCNLDAGGMTRMLDRLETKGLCKRERSAQDRRVVHIELTPEGRTAAEQIPAQLSGVHDIARHGFTAEEYHQLRDYLRRILENVQRLSPGGADTEQQDGNG